MPEHPEGELPQATSPNVPENQEPPALATPPTPTESPLLVWARINVGLPVIYSLISILLASTHKAYAPGVTAFFIWGLGGGLLLIGLLVVLNIRACRPFAGGRAWLHALLALGSVNVGMGIAFAGCGLSFLAMETFR
jgi:hypothetical protein